MSVYELTFLLKPEDKEESKKIRELLQSFSAKLLGETIWEKKKLAYPIKKIETADYYLWQIAVDASQIGELRKRLNFNEKIIRYLLLKIASKKQVLNKGRQ
ncbi:MAG: 30S ribosomal protein S6 [Microgenomates group bacterium]|nr:30S ribosomal protein S6 [Microgenomates group bacterium]